MGFGIALLGYCFLLLNEIGGAIIASPMLAYGFFLASKFGKKFLYASVSALFLFPRGAVNLLAGFGVIKIESLPNLNTITFLLHLSAWLLMSVFWLSAVADIAREGEAKKLFSQANRRIAFTSLFIMASILLVALNTAGVLGAFASKAMMLQYILQYAVIIINVLFLHTCFTLITSQSQYEKDIQYIASENAKIQEKKHKDMLKEEQRLERKRKRK